MNQNICKLQVPEGLDKTLPEAPTVAICRDILAERMLNIAKDYKLEQFVHINQPNFEKEVEASGLMLLDLERYLNFPISSILTPTKASHAAEKLFQTVSIPFRYASDKNAVIDRISATLKGWNKRASVAGEICLVADEMFTNAIYNAPYVKYSVNGPGADRTSSFGDCPDLRQARIFLGRDEERIVIGCEDKYGSLNPRHLVARLQACFDSGGRAINWNGGGAGIGTYIVLRSALAYYAGVAEGSRTVVACTFSNAGRRSDTIQNLHLGAIERSA